jgi:hypothetical protein
VGFNAFALAAPASLLFGALLASRAPDVIAARRRAVMGAGLGALASALALFRISGIAPLESALFELAVAASHARSLVSFAIAVSAVMGLGLTPALHTRQRDIALLATLLSVAVALPLPASLAWVGALVAASMALLLLQMRGRPDAQEARALMTCLVLLPGMALAASQVVPGSTAWILWFCLVLGVWPLHGWYLRLADILPLPFLGALLLVQSGLVGNPAAVPVGSMEGPLSAVMASSAFALALLGLAQRSARRAAASLVLSQLAMTSFASLAIHGVPPAGRLYLLLTLALATVGWVMLLGALEARRGGPLSVFEPTGCYESWPRLATAFMVLGLVSAGLPLSLGYVASDLVIRATFASRPVATVLIILALALNAICVLRMFLYLFQGAPGRPQPSDLRPRELAVTVLAMLAIFGLTFFGLPR